jgi:hypothetical protein
MEWNMIEQELKRTEQNRLEKDNRKEYDRIK